MSRPTCALAKLMPVPMDTEGVKRDGWQEQEILVVSLDDPRLGMIEREFVKQIGEKLYGNRNRRR